ncbi:MAG: NCS2 family permease, partial [Bacillota bacterium]|nr:NCS2 family permease [Bacillota bacterium]
MDFGALLQDLLAALAVVLNGIPQGLLALSVGFASVPTSLGFIIGAVATGAFGSVAPVSFQAETLVLAGQVGRDREERISMVIWAAVLTALLGVFGVISRVMTWGGETILSAMMAGVGFMLARTALEMGKKRRLVTAVSIASAVLLYFFVTTNLLWIVVGSMLISSVVSIVQRVRDGSLGETDIPAEKPFQMSFVRPTLSLNIVRGALALSC